MIRCFVTVAGPYALLPFFLRHYILRGVEHFILSAYERNYTHFARILDIVMEECRRGRVTFQIGFHETNREMDWRHRGLEIAKIAHKHRWYDDWTLYPDLDEFARFPVSLREYFDALPSDVEVVQGKWLDRIATAGEFVPVRPRLTLDEQFPLQGHLVEPIAHATTRIIVACKGVIPTWHHPGSPKCPTANRVLNNNPVTVHHFRWQRHYLQRMRERLAHYKKLGRNNVPQIEMFVRYFEKHGRIPIEDKRFKICPVKCPLGI